MSKKFTRLNLIALSALLIAVFSVDHAAQSVRAEKTGAVAGYVRDKTDESGPNRTRTVEPAPVKSAAPPSAEQLADFERKIFEMVNQKRAENGLTPIRWSEDVAKIARLHSENMVRFKFFSHRGTDGKMVDERADETGLTRWALIGENIAFNRGFDDPLETAVEKWMLSPTHRENILNGGWKESAIGIAVAGDGAYYFTQVFLKRK